MKIFEFKKMESENSKLKPINRCSSRKQYEMMQNRPADKKFTQASASAKKDSNHILSLDSCKITVIYCNEHMRYQQSKRQKSLKCFLFFSIC